LAREALKIRGFPFIISATAEADDSILGMQLDFVNAHYSNTPNGKVGVAMG